MITNGRTDTVHLFIFYCNNRVLVLLLLGKMIKNLLLVELKTLYFGKLQEKQLRKSVAKLEGIKNLIQFVVVNT